MKNQTGRSNWGCLGTIVLFIVLWIICFGFTWGNTHFGISCSTREGVKIDKTSR